MTLNGFRRLLKKLGFRPCVFKYGDGSIDTTWRSPSNYFEVEEGRRMKSDKDHGYFFIRAAPGRFQLPFYFQYNKDISSNLTGVRVDSAECGYVSAVDPEIKILKRLYDGVKEP